jgi:hypothetical protein
LIQVKRAEETSGKRRAGAGTRPQAGLAAARRGEIFPVTDKRFDLDQCIFSQFCETADAFDQARY